jgi:stress response protein YsnF
LRAAWIAEHEVVLHEEEVVVDKQSVPKERVRLDKDVVTDEQQVSETVRKEQVETEGVPPPRAAS